MLVGLSIALLVFSFLLLLVNIVILFFVFMFIMYDEFFEILFVSIFLERLFLSKRMMARRKGRVSYVGEKFLLMR